MLRHSSLFLLLMALFALPLRPGCADILPEGFTFRRPLNFKQAVCDAPGPNAAVAEFYTNGQAKADGSDIRVTTAERILVPQKILQISPKDDFVRIAFATLGDGPYDVWWGDAKAGGGGAGLAPAKELDIKRGIFAEVFRTPAGAQREARNAQGLDKLFHQNKPMGAVFVPEIFLGYNPLGEEWDTMFHYQSQFKIDKAITADFAFTVANTGALTIDGKVIAEEIRSGIKGRVRDPKPVALSAGWHSIDVTQVNLDGGQTGVVVAWRRPEDRRYEPLPALLFAPIARAAAGPLEHVGGGGGENTYAADFGVTPEAEAFSPPSNYLQRYTFDANYPANFQPKISWDFGDGQTAGDLKRVSHIFLAPGIYTVTLKVEQGGHAFTGVQRITVKDRMYSRFPHPPEDPWKTVAAVLASYNLQKLTGEQALRGYLHFKQAGDSENAAAWGKAWAAIKDAPQEGGRMTFDETFDLSRLLELRKEYKDAAEVYRLASGKSLPMEERLELMRSYVMTACDDTDGADAALREAQSWEKLINENNAQQVRTLQAAIAYAAVAAGDGKTARAALDQLAPKDRGALTGTAYNDAQIRQGVLARNIESYIRTKDYDTAVKLIDDWDLEFPEALWDGFTRTLRVKLDAAEGRPQVAARIALQHAKANPDGFYAAELLYRAAQNFKAAGETSQANAAMDLLTRKYPESPYARGETKAP